MAAWASPTMSQRLPNVMATARRATSHPSFGRERLRKFIERSLSSPIGRCQERASHQNFGYRAGGRTSEVTVTHSEPREEPVTRPSLREYATVQRERYLAATRAEKG